MLPTSPQSSGATENHTFLSVAPSLVSFHLEHPAGSWLSTTSAHRRRPGQGRQLCSKGKADGAQSSASPTPLPTARWPGMEDHLQESGTSVSTGCLPAPEKETELRKQNTQISPLCEMSSGLSYSGSAPAASARHTNKPGREGGGRVASPTSHPAAAAGPRGP